MALFMSSETYEVTWRQHTFNTEVLSGFLVPIGDQDESYLVAHVPNTKGGWDVKIIESISATGGYTKANKLGSEKIEGRPYYKAIPLEHWKTYLEVNPRFTFVDHKKVLESKTESGIIPNTKDAPEIQRRSPIKKSSTKSKRYSPTLQRDMLGEKPIIKS